MLCGTFYNRKYYGRIRNLNLERSVRAKYLTSAKSMKTYFNTTKPKLRAEHGYTCKDIRFQLEVHPGPGTHNYHTATKIELTFLVSIG